MDGILRKAYYLNGVEVSKPNMVYSGNDKCILNPTDSMLIELGYEIKQVDTPEYSEPELSYEERVVELIRLRYSADEEFAILRQRDRKPEEFAEYDAYCEECKAQAKEGV